MMRGMTIEARVTGSTPLTETQSIYFKSMNGSSILSDSVKFEFSIDGTTTYKQISQTIFSVIRLVRNKFYCLTIFGLKSLDVTFAKTSAYMSNRAVIRSVQKSRI